VSSDLTSTQATSVVAGGRAGLGSLVSCRHRRLEVGGDADDAGGRSRLPERWSAGRETATGSR